MHKIKNHKGIKIHLNLRPEHRKNNTLAKNTLFNQYNISVNKNSWIIACLLSLK